MFDDHEVIVGLYTFSLDSKAAAALLKHYGKKNVLIYFCKHGSPLPGNIPSNKFSKVKIISLGVNITNYEDYDHISIENDGYTSACKTLYDMSLKENDLINPIEESNLLWIDMISRFHVRRDCMVAEDAYGFSLYLSMFDTYVSNSKPSYIWESLINKPEYVNYAMEESYKLFLYKQKTFLNFNPHIFSLDILGNSCLMINRRDMDSSVFLEYKGRSEYDYLICFQDMYGKRELQQNKDLISLLKEADTSLIFTVYKNKDKSSIDFSEKFGGKGHRGVSTFSLKHDFNISEHYISSSSSDTLEDTENYLSDTVKKFIKSEYYNLYKTSIKECSPINVHHKFIFNGVPIPFVTRLAIIPYMRYQYDKEYINILINNHFNRKNYNE